MLICRPIKLLKDFRFQTLTAQKCNLGFKGQLRRQVLEILANSSYLNEDSKAVRDDRLGFSISFDPTTATFYSSIFTRLATTQDCNENLTRRKNNNSNDEHRSKSNLGTEQGDNTNTNNKMDNRNNNNAPLALIALTILGFTWFWFIRNTNLELRLYNFLPLRVTSSLWGKVNSYDLPIWMRAGLYEFFCRAYNCDMSEALESDYRSYKNLSEFFSRRLKPNLRPISTEPGVVSPADGLILHFGPIENGQVEGVKGLNYSIEAFLGLSSKNNDYIDELQIKPENDLYTCIIYLAPGDYHRFHSPTNWLVKHRKHFPGRLLSVRPSLVKRLPKVLHINERVCYFGEWPHGFFSMTAVGATNVGSIKVNFDEDLRTNRRLLWRPDRYACFQHQFKDNIELLAGQDFGEFNFGSTIVLIFEAPKGSKFDLEGDNHKIKFGQLLARIEPPASSIRNRELIKSSAR